MSYISNGQDYTYGLKTLATIQALTGMQTGDTCYCTDYDRIMTYDGSDWMCDDFVKLVTDSAVVQWDIVVVSNGGTASQVSCQTTSISANGRVLGVVVNSAGASAGGTVVVAIKGNWRVNVRASTANGSPLTTSASSGKAQELSVASYFGVFGFATSSSAAAGTISCIIIPKKELNG
jgi:hypothetical protein